MTAQQQLRSLCALHTRDLIRRAIGVTAHTLDNWLSETDPKRIGMLGSRLINLIAIIDQTAPERLTRAILRDLARLPITGRKPPRGRQNKSTATGAGTDTQDLY